MALRRTLEPEVMDAPEDAAQYDRVDHGFVNQAFVDDVVELLQGAVNLHHALNSRQAESFRVLDVGTANALIPIYLCQRHHAVHVTAIDMSDRMLELAATHIGRTPHQDRIQLAKVDAKGMAFASQSFDAVTCKSTIHHIPNPVDCLSEIVRVCKIGGAVLVRDMMRPDNETELESIVQTYVGKETQYAQRQYRESLHAALSLEEIRAIVSGLGWDGGEVRATSDRHWTWAAINRSNSA